MELELGTLVLCLCNLSIDFNLFGDVDLEDENEDFKDIVLEIVEFECLWKFGPTTDLDLKIRLGLLSCKNFLIGEVLVDGCLDLDCCCCC